MGLRTTQLGKQETWKETIFLRYGSVRRAMEKKLGSFLPRIRRIKDEESQFALLNPPLSFGEIVQQSAVIVKFNRRVNRAVFTGCVTPTVRGTNF